MFGIAQNNSKNIWAQVVAYYAVNFRSFEMSPHKHSMWEIMLVVKGTAEITYWLTDEVPNKILLHEGTFIIIDSGIKHELYVDKASPCRMLNVELEPIKAKNIFTLENLFKQDTKLTSEKVMLEHDADACMHSIIISLQRQLKLDGNTGCEQSDWILGQLFLTILREYNIKSEKRGNRYVLLAEEFISENYEQDITIDAIADNIGISKAHLQRLYKEKNGYSIVEKVNELRINKAKFLLLSSSLSIVDIAINVGFNNRQHFSHVFVQHLNCSPGEFRKKERLLSVKQFDDLQLYPENDSKFFKNTFVKNH